MPAGIAPLYFPPGAIHCRMGFSLLPVPAACFCIFLDVFDYCLVLLIAFSLFSCLRRGDFLVRKDIFQSMSLIIFDRASGEAILGIQRYVSKHFLIFFCPCLRRCDFRYTTTLFKACPCHFLSPLRRGDLRYTTILFKTFPYHLLFTPPAGRF